MKNKNKTILKPWGKYILLEKKRDYWIKKLCVRQGARISLQSHKGRFEIWIVLSGSVEVMKGSSRLLLKEGDFLKINKKEKHRITGLKDSWILEAAFGQVRENDIIRFKDDYGRIKSR
ncbi:mannose-6-phosphate isomerase [Candidatus Jorgensenbacteria bacterium CG10_big_fil_rev_8_21_14_0_10_54_38]|uniref:Mannose-6-phosphate isomerase n=2 Tax=Parcubacteria group TaxID=1794811 RepID=A0A2M6WGF1_9BACT|nr:MAG: mannose-6-phosphate isomerase [Candidatus Jorgensenbacteria bacterium CG10_big_fil_rev_8_21_14_0_10_54_38]PIU98302.1 MAG: mannose-6-phosphate isomerase [Candidatus Wolfebacteria bacterium CG03_land_8_20_14_0_80_40_12]